jgi:broad specificity phosphatase PhoE
MKPGTETLLLIDDVLAKDIGHIVLIMRHSAREFAPDKHDLLNPLTDEGRELALDMGERLPKSLLLRGYASPAERCVETAELILQGHERGGGRITRSRPAEALGVFYILDQMRMYKAMQAAGGQAPLLEEWFRGNVADDILIPADLAARLVAVFAARKLEGGSPEPRLDVLVSHDMTLYTLKDRLLRQPASEHGGVNFLDGLAVYNLEGRLWIQSHHGEAVPLAI